MAIKNALIVDDSKSARLVLKRLLNDLDLVVDTVESATDAMDYLKDHTPDVIFMDHMMPGMDGFEAVKHIKNNAKTAVIPIMMYTSRGGDVYLSQARALGAVGVIPKTISPVGLKESLFKLGLVKDRRVASTLQVEEKKIEDRPINETVKKQVEDGLIKKHEEHDAYIDDLRKLMDDQTIELHKSMWLGIESVSYEIFNRLNSELDEHFKKLQPADQEMNVDAESVAEGGISWPLLITGTVLVASIILNITLLSNAHKHEDVVLASDDEETVILDKEQVTVQRSGEDQATTQAATNEFIRWAQSREIEYPFDELALNENRLPGIENLIKKAVEANYSGSIILQTHVGRFCLSRDPVGNYKLAEDELPVTQCAYIGNHVQPYDVPSTHQSLSFANYLSDLSSLNAKGIEVEVSNVSRAFELSKYPQPGSQTTVEEWNLAAKLNNRIIVKLDPALTTNTTEPLLETEGAYFE